MKAEIEPQDIELIIKEALTRYEKGKEAHGEFENVNWEVSLAESSIRDF